MCLPKSRPSSFSFNSHDSLAGKTVIITGCNRGVGYEAAVMLAKLHPSRLILACRDLSKASKAAEEISLVSECKTVEPWLLDLSSFQSIRQFAERFNATGDGKLHLLVQNAAMITWVYERTNDDWESNLQVNHLSPSLLVLLLLPNLVRAGTINDPSRLVMVSSYGHASFSNVPEANITNGRMMDLLNDPKHCSKPFVMMYRYLLGKLFQILWIRSLLQQCPSQMPVTVLHCDPGLCNTEFTAECRRRHWYKVVWALMTTFGSHSAHEGGQRVYHGAIRGTHAELQGRYLSEYKVSPTSHFARSDASKILEKRLWDETYDIISEAAPEITDILEKHIKQ